VEEGPPSRDHAFVHAELCMMVSAGPYGVQSKFPSQERVSRKVHSSTEM